MDIRLPFGIFIGVRPNKPSNRPAKEYMEGRNHDHIVDSSDIFRSQRLSANTVRTIPCYFHPKHIAGLKHPSKTSPCHLGYIPPLAVSVDILF